MLDRLVFTVVSLGLGLADLGRYQDAISQVNLGLQIAKELNARREFAMGYFLLGRAYLGLREFELALAYL